MKTRPDPFSNFGHHIPDYESIKFFSGEHQRLSQDNIWTFFWEVFWMEVAVTINGLKFKQNGRN